MNTYRRQNVACRRQSFAQTRETLHFVNKRPACVVASDFLDVSCNFMVVTNSLHNMAQQLTPLAQSRIISTNSVFEKIDLLAASRVASLTQVKNSQPTL